MINVADIPLYGCIAFTFSEKINLLQTLGGLRTSLPGRLDVGKLALDKPGDRVAS